MDTAIGFLLDQSGSIDSKRGETSVLTALCVVEFAQVFGIPVCVNGHCTGREHIGRKREEIVCLHSYLAVSYTHLDVYKRQEVVDCIGKTKYFYFRDKYGVQWEFEQGHTDVGNDR